VTTTVTAIIRRRSVLRGAGWSVALCYVPLAPLLGGVVAGRSAGGSDRLAHRGATLGTFAGLVAAPALSTVTVLPWLFLVGRGGGPPPVRIIMAECAGLALAAAVYTVGLSAAGGLLGAHRARNTKGT
jgi:hypothetical protein